MNLGMNFLKTITVDNCEGLGPIVELVKRVLGIAFVILGVVLVVLIVIDIAKAIIASEEKEVKGYQKAAIRRVIYFVIMFFVVMLVTVVTNLLGKTSGIDQEGATSWKACWGNPIYTCEDANNDNKCDK